MRRFSKISISIMSASILGSIVLGSVPEVAKASGWSESTPKKLRGIWYTKYNKYGHGYYRYRMRIVKKGLYINEFDYATKHSRYKLVGSTVGINKDISSRQYKKNKFYIYGNWNNVYTENDFKVNRKSAKKITVHYDGEQEGSYKMVGTFYKK